MDRDVRRNREPGAMRALVTGGARGLGEAVAARLVRDGWDVALLDLAPSVAQTAERIASLREGARLLAFNGDVCDEETVDGALAETVSAFGGLDLLVNNAGMGGPSTDLLDTPTEEIRRVLDVNLLGAFIAARRAARVMVDQGSGGSIINIGSIYGQQGIAGGAAYSASKGGITLLTHSLALELAPHGIRVNTIAPGNMATEMHFESLRKDAEQKGTGFEQELEAIRGSIPLGRHGTGDDIAGAVAWLASEDASYVTGQLIGVNGGVILT
jgi:NAD(P)-dependent dehydrogenase (short-subunit alcohol dehydrogenase family)